MNRDDLKMIFKLKIYLPCVKNIFNVWTINTVGNFKNTFIIEKYKIYININIYTCVYILVVKRISVSTVRFR